MYNGAILLLMILYISPRLSQYFLMHKMSGSEFWGQEEAACMCIFRPMQHYNDSLCSVGFRVLDAVICGGAILCSCTA